MDELEIRKLKKKKEEEEKKKEHRIGGKTRAEFLRHAMQRGRGAQTQSMPWWAAGPTAACILECGPKLPRNRPTTG